MWFRVSLLLALAVGCGRIGYEPLEVGAVGDDAGSDPNVVAITAPSNGNDFATDLQAVVVSGTCDPGVVRMATSHGSFADADCTDGTWSLDSFDLVAGGSLIVIAAENPEGDISRASLDIVFLEALERYRSVSPGSTAAIAEGSGNKMQIEGLTARFESFVPPHVGVGDAIQYDTDGDAIVDAVAFVHGRVSNTELALRTSDGNNAPETVDNTDWQIFRAYTSLNDALHGRENAGIDAALRNFDPNSNTKDLVADNEVWKIACYGNGPDTTPVLEDAFTTDATHYLEIFTPNRPWQTGASQRHAGKWDPDAYHLVASNSDVVNFISGNHIRVDGLQVYLESVDASNQKAMEFNTPGNGDLRISNSIFRGVGVSNFSFHSGLVIWSAGSGEARIWNNIAYDFERPNGVDGIAFHLHDPQFMFYVYNNTAHGSRCGFGEDFGTPIIAKNNLSYGNTNNYCGVFEAASSNNLSGPTGTDAPGSNAFNASSVLFVDEAGDDFHLDKTNAAARGTGVNLSQDPFIPILDDIDGQPRPAGAPFDLGADQTL
jgi:hypothetical protein